MTLRKLWKFGISIMICSLSQNLLSSYKWNICWYWHIYCSVVYSNKTSEHKSTVFYFKNSEPLLVAVTELDKYYIMFLVHTIHIYFILVFMLYDKNVWCYLGLFFIKQLYAKTLGKFTNNHYWEDSDMGKNITFS